MQIKIALYNCGRGHSIASWAGDNPIDLTGYYCPLCMGPIVGHGDIIDLGILAPVQSLIGA